LKLGKIKEITKIRKSTGNSQTIRLALNSKDFIRQF
jgi:hypothetical protein